jgi:excisionase family DNA binding protein
MNEQEAFVDAAAVGAHLSGKSAYTIRQWAKAGVIPGVKVGGTWLFKLSEIDAHLAQPKDPWYQSARSRGRRRAA